VLEGTTDRLKGNAGMLSRQEHLALVDNTLNYAKHLLCGALSAVVSRTFCAPLERVKMQMIFFNRTGSTMQVAQEVLQKEGLQGFWRGNGVVCTTSVCCTFCSVPNSCLNELRLVWLASVVQYCFLLYAGINILRTAPYKVLPTCNIHIFKRYLLSF
jgi:hypothetical protein